jgi:hypothetical protein
VTQPASPPLTKVLAELRAQGWTLSPSPDNERWRAEPPHRGKAVLFLARATDVVAVVRQLQDQGFRWPPPGARPEPVVRAAPFAPKPHPEVGLDGAPPPTRALALVTPAPAVDPDRAFARLKETREYRLLAAQELAEAKESYLLAKAVLEGAQAVHDDAVAEEQRAKAAFDSVFNGGRS